MNMRFKIIQIYSKLFMDITIMRQKCNGMEHTLRKSIDIITKQSR